MVKTLRIVVMGFFIVSVWTSSTAGQDLRALESMVAGATSGDGPGRLLPLLLEKIGLTPEQNQRVKEILVAHRETLRSLFIELHAANAEMANLLFVPDEISAEDLAPQARRITRLREQLLVEGLNTVLEVRAVLTPEQRAKIARLKEQLQVFHGALGELSTK